MKKVMLMSAIALFGFAGTTFAQDLRPNQVPSAIQQEFQKSFPEASDVEWEKEMNHYDVEFEVGLLGTDHEAWYDENGKLLRHEEEISKRDLPKEVTNTINKEFDGFRIGDVTKITKGDQVNYTMELENRDEEWDVAIDANGKILQQKND